MTPERRKELEERARSIAREELNAGFSTIGTARAVAPLAQIILRGMEAVDREAEERAFPRCPECGGRGEKAYADTTTWRGGIGGQTVTASVCDKCWGTGRSDVTGPDQRRISAEFDKRVREAEERGRREERERCEGIVRDYLTGIYIVSKSGTHIASGCDDICRRIKGEPR